jgi:UPF0755 protein
MKYTMKPRKRRWPRRLLIIIGLLIAITVAATIIVRQKYNDGLKPVSVSTTSQEVTIKSGATVAQIAAILEEKRLIRSAWAFKLYVSSKEVRGALQAGTYAIEPSQSVPEIVAQLTHGRIATSLVTILPGQRLDQIRTRFEKDGFTRADIDAALDPARYKGHPALVDLPNGASLEGYLYPESFQKSASTDPKGIISQSLDAMQQRLTAERRSAFTRQNLSAHQAVILASILEKEVSKPGDRAQVAQVFLKRLRQNMKLQSDVTAFYGAVIAGAEPSVVYDSPYNTYLHAGLPAGPISNVSESSLEAVAHPAGTDWLYFVAGDDGSTYFSKTLAEHEALTKEHCKRLCSP